MIELLGLKKFHVVASAAGGTIATDYALSHPDRLESLTIADNATGVRDGEIAKAANNIRTKGFDDMPVEFRELGPSYRAANPEGARVWTELAHKAVIAPDYRQPVANEITTARLEAMRVRTLLITGDADLITPPSIMRMVARHIAGSEISIDHRIRTLRLLGAARCLQPRGAGVHRQAGEVIGSCSPDEANGSARSAAR